MAAHEARVISEQSGSAGPAAIRPSSLFSSVDSDVHKWIAKVESELAIRDTRTVKLTRKHLNELQDLKQKCATLKWQQLEFYIRRNVIARIGALETACEHLKCLLNVLDCLNDDGLSKADQSEACARKLRNALDSLSVIKHTSDGAKIFLTHRAVLMDFSKQMLTLLRCTAEVRDRGPGRDAYLTGRRLFDGLQRLGKTLARQEMRSVPTLHTPLNSAFVKARTLEKDVREKYLPDSRGTAPVYLQKSQSQPIPEPPRLPQLLPAPPKDQQLRPAKVPAPLLETSNPQAGARTRKHKSGSPPPAPHPKKQANAHAPQKTGHFQSQPQRNPTVRHWPMPQGNSYNPPSCNPSAGPMSYGQLDRMVDCPGTPGVGHILLTTPESIVDSTAPFMPQGNSYNPPSYNPSAGPMSYGQLDWMVDYPETPRVGHTWPSTPQPIVYPNDPFHSGLYESYPELKHKWHSAHYGTNGAQL